MSQEKIPLRKLFRIYFDGDLLGWLTPWWLLQLSYGGHNWEYRTLWWGVKLAWSRCLHIEEGGEIFSRRWKLVFREYTYEILEVLGGPPL